MNTWQTAALDMLRLNCDWLWRADAHGRLLNWEPASRFNFGEISIDENLLFCQEYFRYEFGTRSAYVSLMRTIQKKLPFRCHKIACYLPHTGIRGWVKLSGVPIFDATGQLAGYQGGAINLTGQMMAERKIDRQSAHIHSLMYALEAAPIGMMIIDKDPAGAITTRFKNKAIERIYGASLIEGECDLLYGFLKANKDNMAIMGRLREDLLAYGIASMQLELGRYDDTPFWGDVTFIQSRLPEGVTQYVLMLRDVTLKRLYEVHNQQRDRLEALGRLAGGLAHEISNLLQPAQLYAEMLADDLGLSKVDQMAYAKDILSGIEQVRQITRNTLLFARQDERSEHLEPPKAQVFSTLLSEQLQYLRRLLPSTMTVDAQGVENVSVYATVPRTELTQVLSNLLNNAAHAMGNKGKIVITLSEIEVDGVKIAKPVPHGRYLELRVKDTGSGMTQDVAARIFEPFYTTKNPNEGTGLGLSVVYGLVMNWRGHIAVESTPNEGTCFSILIPSLSQGEVDNGFMQESSSG